jgi:hypothetical protein
MGKNNNRDDKPKTTTIVIGGDKYKIEGNKVNAGELGKIATGTGRGLQDLKDTLANKGFSLANSGKQYYQTNKNTINQPTNQTSTAAAGGDAQAEDYGRNDDGTPRTPWQAYTDFELGKGSQQGEFGLESDRIRTASAAEIAKINAAASNYGYDRQLEGTKYATDSEERWRQAVATIEGDKKASLQNIINAGLKDVAEIEGSYSLKNVEKKGEWDYKTMGLKTEADKDIARMDANQKMYNLLGIAFG